MGAGKQDQHMKAQGQGISRIPTALEGGRRAGKKDQHMMLVVTESSPKCWLHNDSRVRATRPFATRAHTRNFANAFAGQLRHHGVKLALALRSQRAEWWQGGCELGSLVNIHFQTSGSLALDIL